MTSVLGGLTLFCVAIGLVQLTFLLGLGWSETRRARRAAPDADALPWRPAAIFALVPCLNEATVIEATVRSLLDQHPDLRVVVIDDASDDDTALIAAKSGGDRAIVLRRTLPEARLGKGPALNHAFAEIQRVVADEGHDPSDVIVMVMDADGHLSPGAIGQVAPLFADERVGGAQLGVRIRNRRDNVLAAIQDCEFWGIAALGQMGRMRTRTVSLGGNGQFTRLAALESVGGQPWSRSLTEDLDLAVTLSVLGWHLTSTPDAWVTQQGLTRVRPLLKQRTRWFQGHMTVATTRLGEVWRSPFLPNLAVLEMTSYLLIPFILVLPWSILSQISLISTLTDLSSFAPPANTGLPGPAWLLPVAFWYVMSFAPTILCGYIYSRREDDISPIRAVLFSHVLVLWNYVLFLACWRGVFRMVTGRTGWDKTARVVEAAAHLPVSEAAS